MVQDEELLDQEEGAVGEVSDESLDELLGDEEDEEEVEEGSGDEFGDDGKEELGAW